MSVALTEAESGMSLIELTCARLKKSSNALLYRLTIFNRVLDLQHALKLLYQLVPSLRDAFPVFEGRCIMDGLCGEKVTKVLEFDRGLLMLF